MGSRWDLAAAGGWSWAIGKHKNDQGGTPQRLKYQMMTKIQQTIYIYILIFMLVNAETMHTLYSGMLDPSAVGTDFGLGPPSLGYL